MILWMWIRRSTFMLRRGAVRTGAERTIPAMERLIEAARAAGVVHVASPTTTS